MNKQRKQGLITMVIAGIVILIGGYSIFSDSSTDAVPKETANATTSPATTTLEDLGITVDGIEGATIELVEIEPPEITFDLERPIVYTGAFADNVEAQQIMTKKVSDVVSSIEQSGGTFANWIDLGTYWKQVDDYEGAILAWNYASELRPLNHVSYSNLGNLYHLYVQDYEKAEENFLIAIENKSDNIPAYIELHSLYANSYTEKAHLAAAVLEQGLLANPGNSTLISALEQYNAR